MTTETPNATLLRRAICFAPSWYSWNLQSEAIALVDAADKGGGRVTVDWHECANGATLMRTTGDGYRLYAAGPSMSKLDRRNINLRAVAQYERVVPVDIVSCHPTILATPHEVVAVPPEALCEYVEDREPKLSAVMQHYGVDREAAKHLFLMLTFGGKAIRGVRNAISACPRTSRSRCSSSTRWRR